MSFFTAKTRVHMIFLVGIAMWAYIMRNIVLAALQNPVYWVGAMGGVPVLVAFVRMYKDAVKGVSE